MALDFPASPSIGQLYPASPTVGIPQYTWDGVKWTTTLGTTITGAVASATSPKIDGTATVGTENAWSHGDHVHPSDTSRVAKGGDTMLGLLTLSGAPSSGLHAATKAYVDTADAIPVMPQATAVGKILTRVTAGAGAFEQYAIPELTALSPVAGDFVMGAPGAGGAPRKIDVASLAAGVVPQAQGRLTLVSNQPQMTNVAGASTVFYTPYNGLIVPLWNGSLVVAASIGAELSQAVTDTSKSPAATIANKNYDYFVWRDPTGSVMRCTRGPPWTSDVARGTGAGTTELARGGGIVVNAQTITNGPASQRGMYVGTIRTNGAGTIDWNRGGSAAGGLAALLTLWNNYNRFKLITDVRDSASSGWSNNVSAFHAFHDSVGHRVNLLRGLDVEDAVIQFGAYMTINPSTGVAGVAIGIDNTTTPVTSCYSQGVIDYKAPWWCRYPITSLGHHYYQALESGNSGTAGFGHVVGGFPVGGLQAEVMY
jgi:hypothetical protein